MDQDLGIIQCRHDGVPFSGFHGATEYLTTNAAAPKRIRQHRGVLPALRQYQWMSPILYLKEEIRCRQSFGK